MKKDSLKNRIRKYLRRNYPLKINGGTLERLALENGYKASNASRQARKLAEEEIIEPSYTEKGFVEYKYKPTPQEIIKINITGKL